MKNIIRIFNEIKTSGDKGVQTKKIQVEEAILKNIAKRCGIELEEQGERYFWKKEKKEKVLFFSKKEKNTRIAILADLHAGFMQNKETMLTDFLQKCKRQKASYLLIAGDLHEGTQIFTGHEFVLKNKTSIAQAKKNYEILKDVDMTIIFINGNHDYSMEVAGMQNPNLLLYEMLKKDRKKVYFIDHYYANLIIGGIGIRMAHLHKYCGKKEPCIEYANEYKETKIRYEGKKYPIKLFVTGHIHNHEIYSCDDQLILQPGSIKNPNCKEIGFILEIKKSNSKKAHYKIL